MRFRLLLFAGGLLFSNMASGTGLPSGYAKTDFQQATLSASQNGLPILVYFWANQCGPCNYTGGVFDAKDVRLSYLGRFNFVDTLGWTPDSSIVKTMKASGFDWARVRWWGERAAISAPNLVILNANAQYVCTVTGGFNNKAHAKNIASSIKNMLETTPKLNSTERIECPGAQV